MKSKSFLFFVFTLVVVLSISQLNCWALVFSYPVKGKIKYSALPVDSGAAFDEDDQKTWYTMVWTGRYGGLCTSGDDRGEETGGHPGVDIRDRYDLGVYAVADGTIVKAESYGGWGNFIVIKHENVDGLEGIDDDDTIFSIYAHLVDGFEPNVAEGVEVERKQLLGTMGESGGVVRHLHFQIDKDWPDTQNSPYWVSGYPARDDCNLSESQLQAAAQDVINNTINPIQFIESHLYSGCPWPNNPTVNVPISTAPNNQTIPQITTDGAGGAIIAWIDSRNQEYEIYSQRIDANGNVMWTAMASSSPRM